MGVSSLDGSFAYQSWFTVLGNCRQSAPFAYLSFHWRFFQRTLPQKWRV